jgi:hypothetical protein
MPAGGHRPAKQDSDYLACADTSSAVMMEFAKIVPPENMLQNGLAFTENSRSRHVAGWNRRAGK